MKIKSNHPTLFLSILEDAGIPPPTRELQFDARPKDGTVRPKVPRGWKFDYAWKGEKVALEVDGGLYTRGRHVQGAGRREDMRKQTEAAIQGWRIVYTTPGDMGSHQNISDIRRARSCAR